MEKKNLVVQLFAPTEGKLGEIGTAYPVAKDVLLTAAHVIGDAEAATVQARWWHQPDTDRAWRNCIKILWDGREQTPKSDVMLLSCTFPKSAERQWGLLAAIRPTDHGQWSSEGFPFVGERNTKPVPLQGKTHSMGDRSDHFHLQVDASAKTESDWQGASGSPVFVNETVIGVIVNSPLKFNAERFEAVPVFKLVDNAEFRELVAYSEADDQRRQLMQKAVTELAKSFLAMQRLARLLKRSDPNDDKESAQQIVNDLLDDANPAKIAAAIVKAQRDIGDGDEQHQKAIQCLDSVAMYLIPASLASDHVQQIQVIADSDHDKYDFQAQTKTFVEMGMARLHGRPANYRMPKGQNDKPPGRLSLESPVEAEIDTDGAKFKRDFVAGLAHVLALGDLSESEDAVDEINDELEVRDDLGEGLHYYVFHLPENESDRMRRLGVVRELDALFPRITFIGLEPGKGTSQERQSVRLVLRLLCRAAGIEWKTDAQAETAEGPRQSD